MEAALVEDEVYCRGLNSRISAKKDLVIISRLLPPGKTEIPVSRLRAVELAINSIFPPILLSLSSAVFLVVVWWFAGGGSWPIALDETYRSVCSWAVLGAVLGVTVAGYSWVFGSINITTIDSHARIVIRMVPRRSGEKFVNALRNMTRSREE